MKIVLIVGYSLLYLMIGRAWTTFVTACRNERRKQGEPDAEPFSEWTLGFAVLAWPIWTALGLMFGLGMLVKTVAEKAGGKK